MSSFGQTVREARERKKISLRSFASEMGRSGSWFSKVERDLEIPGAEVVRHIATRLELDQDDLFAKLGKPAPDLVAIIMRNPKAARNALLNLS